MIEKFFTCPYCWEKISFLIDTSIEEDSYIEDCQVCCRPIELVFKYQNKQFIYFETKRIEGNF